MARHKHPEKALPWEVVCSEVIVDQPPRDDHDPEKLVEVEKTTK